jgi:hypothetical protein
VKKLLLLLLILIPTTAFAEQMLQGGVVQQVDVDEARDAAFANLARIIDTTQYGKIDPDKALNLKARLQHQTCQPNRRLTFFGNGSYGVIYFGEQVGYYYNPQGRLFKLELLNSPATPASFARFPVKGATYLFPSGTLESTRLTPLFARDYNFNPDGSLKFYCLQNTCYRPNGTVAQIRDISTNCTQTDARIIRPAK